jgi:hypothetical protein
MKMKDNSDKLINELGQKFESEDNGKTSRRKKNSIIFKILEQTQDPSPKLMYEYRI